ncbi:MAG: hypothetical protein FWC28_03870 [Proteobacteria bacterium]|nr:hypothetical protein [Cystobacterineae bacterium]MCL2259264.1 hypothetical protein [Cystobacterineae bacterium]MCL2314374.1 hypothetical protein [Pseudomonadota bacterium]
MTAFGALAFPKAIRQMESEALSELCRSLRQHIIISKPPEVERALCVVELTVALHRVFRSPYDVLLFEEAPLALAHRLLTGHVPGFLSPAQAEALARPQDVFEASHGPTALAQAMGLMEGRKRLGHRGRVVVILEEQRPLRMEALEALCQVGASGVPWLGVLARHGGEGGAFLPWGELAVFLGSYGVGLWPTLEGGDIGAMEGVFRRVKVAHKAMLMHLQLPPLAPVISPYREAQARVLRRLMEADSRVILLVSSSIPPMELERAFAGRVRRLASSVAHGLAFAAGLSRAGLRPIYLLPREASLEWVSLSNRASGVPLSIWEVNGGEWEVNGEEAEGMEESPGVTIGVI